MKKIVASFAILTLALFAVSASAQTVTSNTQTVALNAVVPEAITLDAPSASVINFVIAGTPFSTSATNGDVAPTFNVNYSLKANRSFTVCAYLPGTGALVGTGTNNDKISSGNILGKFNGAGAFVAFDGNTACGQAHGLIVDTITSTSALHSVTKNEKVEMQVGPLGGITPDTYTGTLNLVAQSI